MAFPEPKVGLVIRYSYLWRSEHRKGQEEGVKDRPCAIVLLTEAEGGDRLVTVLPITHSPPSDMRLAVEIPPATKARLDLDADRSWVVLAEANRFVWPGPDLRPLVPGAPESVAYGYLPYRFTQEILRRFLELVRERRGGLVRRTE